jgi:signal transduction protein with GAF and PtsI domain
MFEEFNRELMNAKEKLWRKQKFESLVNQTRESLQKELGRKIKLENILQDEDKDVKKLESLSITSIFYSMLGSKHEQLEKERQELLSARLKYDECCKSVLALERELVSSKASLDSLLGADYEYETALKRKEEFILQFNDANSQKLFQLMDNLADLEAQKKELKEAITSGETVQIELERVISSLESAEGWGTWDIVGGGLLATAAKHSHIDEAKEYAHHTKIALIRFQNELSDVDLTMDIDIKIGSFETFADYFFDGLISDWVVQSRIRESLDSVQSVAGNVNSVIASLKEKFSIVQNNLLSTEENIKSLVEQA